jgi:nicotinate phosphoribosyltransferase
MPGALSTDLYERNMAASYLRRQMTGTPTFSLFVRRLPAERGFLVAAGVEDCLDFLEAFSFDERDHAYLATERTRYSGAPPGHSTPRRTRHGQPR